MSEPKYGTQFTMFGGLRQYSFRVGGDTPAELLSNVEAFLAEAEERGYSDTPQKSTLRTEELAGYVVATSRRTDGTVQRPVWLYAKAEGLKRRISGGVVWPEQRGRLPFVVSEDKVWPSKNVLEREEAIDSGVFVALPPGYFVTTKPKVDRDGAPVLTDSGHQEWVLDRITHRGETSANGTGHIEGDVKLMNDYTPAKELEALVRDVFSITDEADYRTATRWLFGRYKGSLDKKVAAQLKDWSDLRVADITAITNALKAKPEVYRDDFAKFVATLSESPF